ncbi:MAG: 2-amino-4-hydroxy-6-hydroxymethyldihydropteridine diphosphokinase [Bacteroidales bacterium]
MNDTYILLGGNSGDREMLLREAIRLIADEAGHISRQSSIYETEPWGFLSDSPFLNQAILLHTGFGPEVLLSKLLSIENKLGRKRASSGYVSRTIDLDILLFNDEIISSKKLQVPHPRLQLRRFAMVPLDEIAGDYIHPVFLTTIHQLALDCPDSLKVRVFKSFAGVHVN